MSQYLNIDDNVITLLSSYKYLIIYISYDLSINYYLQVKNYL